jgi:hypothetical protein
MKGGAAEAGSGYPRPEDPDLGCSAIILDDYKET